MRFIVLTKSYPVSEFINDKRTAIESCLKVIKAMDEIGRFRWGYAIGCNEVYVRTTTSQDLYIYYKEWKFGPFTYKWFTGKILGKPMSLPIFMLAD